MTNKNFYYKQLKKANETVEGMDAVVSYLNACSDTLIVARLTVLLTTKLTGGRLSSFKRKIGYEEVEDA
jgi:hypothetical protein